MLAESRIGWRYLPQPVVQMPANEAVIVQRGVCGVDPVDLFHLARRKIFIRVEAPAALEHALAPQDLMKARNASPETIRCIEERGVAVCNLDASRQGV